jgi:very-short-patch-repair endonuclease
MTNNPRVQAAAQKGGDAVRGRPRSEDVRSRIAIGVSIARANGVYANHRTELERNLSRLLSESGLQFEEQVRFGRHVVDAWVPERALVFEADGAYWHQDKEREAQRDAYLIERGALAVVHLTDEDLEF